MAGGTDRRRAGARSRHSRRSPIRTPAFSPPSRRSASRTRSRVTAGCWPRSRMPQHEVRSSIRHFVLLDHAAVRCRRRGRNGRGLLSRQDHRACDRRRTRGRLRRRRPYARQSLQPAHSRQSHRHRQEHAGRRRAGGHQLSLQRRQARRHRDRHADQQRAARAASQAAVARRQQRQIRSGRIFPGSARRCRSPKSPGSGTLRRRRASRT